MKETRTKGLAVCRACVAQASWMIAYTLVFLLVSVLAVAVAGSSFLGTTSGSLLFTYVFAFCQSELAFGVLVSSFFSKAKVRVLRRSALPALSSARQRFSVTLWREVCPVGWFFSKPAASD